MPFEYQRDDANHRIVVIYRGTFQAAEAMAILRRHGVERAGDYETLYDLRYLSGHPTVDDLKQFIREELKHTPLNSAHGPIAIVATDDEIYRMACTYAVLGLNRLQIKVFADRTEAETWLQNVGR